MKNLVYGLFVLILFAFTSCSNDSSPTGTSGIGGNGGPGGGGNNAVTFTISQQNGQQGIVFQATPSAAVVIDGVVVSLPAQNFTDNVGGSTDVFNANEPVSIGEYTGVTSGQKWTFVFTGKLGSATGTAFNVTSNYTVP